MITGIFGDRHAATTAMASLAKAGFRNQQVRIIDARTHNRHELIADRVAGTKRAVLLGLVVGAVGGVVVAGVLIMALGTVSTGVIASLGMTAGGAVIGLAIGSVTNSQIREELEHQVDSGTVLVSVTTNEAGSDIATALLPHDGGSSIIATAMTFTAGVLPTTASR
ncbi:MAG: hypothetical protein ACI8UD_000182 [Planctomycetota bacterium]|jgi:hypothetical protein